ncbi:MAG TPA: hypothetical protein VGW58_00275, partial [Pyrinomonadaceae bacterium]|nr:hypothetical protein [Pyrinomonadaceae bacterium]
MRKLLCALSVVSALVITMAVHAAPPANFAGTWTLDKSKSQGLNPRQQNAESVSLVITQTDKDITLEEKVVGGNPPAGGPPAGAPPAGAPPAGAPPAGAPPAGDRPAGGGGGGRMGGGFGGPRTFNLDGSETSGETGGGRAKFVRKATVSADGKALELTSKTTFQGQDGEITSTTTEKLTLSADGKV